jgi:hypothetical protein
MKNLFVALPRRAAYHCINRRVGQNSLQHTTPTQTTSTHPPTHTHTHQTPTTDMNTKHIDRERAILWLLDPHQHHMTRSAHTQESVWVPSCDQGTKPFLPCKHPKLSLVLSQNQCPADSRILPIENRIVPCLPNTPCPQFDKSV